MLTKTTIGLFAFLLILFASVIPKSLGQEKSSQSPADKVAADIRQILPKGWECIAITEKGKMGHPHGLEEPRFRLDFINTNETFRVEVLPRYTNLVHPNLRLHFHDVQEREHVLRTVEAEQIYSWTIPTLFCETKQFIIVTSPVWINHTVAADETGKIIANVGMTSGEIRSSLFPLEKALKDYCNSRK
jgi:hypothetical protein